MQTRSEAGLVCLQKNWTGLLSNSQEQSKRRDKRHSETDFDARTNLPQAEVVLQLC
jgi:hypothetical protein